MDIDENGIVWVEKYRPKTVNECILPVELKKTFTEFVDKGKFPNLLLLGGAGVGKTTVAKALCNDLGLTSLVINASENGNIDTLRVTIRNFASTKSLTGKKKVVILDEADYLNSQSTQPALRNFMESFHNNVIFILTANFENRIIDPLKSRCSTIRFGNYTKADNMEVKKLFFKRIIEILNLEKIEFQNNTLAGLLKRFYPDYRKTLNELQRLSISGKIDNGAIVTLNSGTFEPLFDALKVKDFKTIRAWVSNNTDLEPSVVIRKIFDSSNEFLKKESEPQMILILNKFDNQNAFVSDKEINLVAMLLEIIIECDMV